MNSKIIRLSIVLSAVIIVMVFIPCIFGRPNGNSPGATNAHSDREEGYEYLTEDDYQRIKPCIHNMTTMELCMRCAKVTKSKVVYPMCCSNEDKVQGWCREYIYYGHTS